MSEKLAKIQKSLFDIQDVELTEKEREKKVRYMDLYTQMLSHPWKPDSFFVTYMDETYGIRTTQAYDDLKAVKIILGDVKNAAKEFQRYTAIEMIKKAVELVMGEDTTKEDIARADVLVKAAKTLGFVTRLNHEDVEPIRWDEVKPAEFEVTGDVSVLGLKKVPDIEARKEKLRKQLFGDNYAKKAPDYTPYEDVE